VSDAPSTKPYLIRAIHEWCADHGFRPYIAVAVDAVTQVPMEFVRGGEIVLNVSPEATNRLVIGNDRIEFEARFNRVARQVSVPIANVSAIYAAENGHGMAFEVPRAPAVPPSPAPAASLVAVPTGAPESDADRTADAERMPDAAVAPPPVESTAAPKRRTRSRKAPDAAAPAAAAPIALVPIPSAGAGQRAESAPDGAGGSAATPAPGGPPVDPSPSSPGPAPGGRPRLTRVK
jgi:stringent starvation protein B